MKNPPTPAGIEPAKSGYYGKLKFCGFYSNIPDFRL